jgi:hypothetical protein
MPTANLTTEALRLLEYLNSVANSSSFKMFPIYELGEHLKIDRSVAEESSIELTNLGLTKKSGPMLAVTVKGVEHLKARKS